MERVPEPELMLGTDQARAYSEANFADPHQAAVDRFRAAFCDFSSGLVLDLGCGPADVTVRFARALPNATFLGIDGSPAMLALARARVAREGLARRVRFEMQRLPAPALGARGPFAAVVATSVLHHLHDPCVLWDTIGASAAPGTRVFVQDLMRPADEPTLRRLVEAYAADEPAQLRDDFEASLRAAFTLDEVRAQVDGRYEVTAVTDRHLVVIGRA